MHIGFDAKRAFCNTTGLGNYSRGIIEGLVKYETNSKLFLFTPNKKLNRLDTLLNNHPKQVQMIKPSVPNPLWRSWSLSYDLPKYHLDIYHGLSHELPISIKKSSQKGKFKTVVTIHDLIYLRYPKLFPWIDRQTYDFKFRYSCQYADRVIAITQQTADDVTQFFGTDSKKIDVVYQSIDESYFKMWSSEKKDELQKKYQLPRNFLLYVGTIEERKNLLLILKAKKIAEEKGAEFPPLVVIGRKRGYYKQVQEYIEKHHLEKKVIFLENIPFADLPGFYQCADLFIFPSFFEGFGLPIVEALASRTPVITSEGGCFPEAGGPGSIYIDPTSDEQLFDQINALLENSDLQEKMKQVGADYAEQFKPSHVIKKLMNCYKQTIS